MQSKPISCGGCPLLPLSTGFLDPEGDCVNGVLILGEAAGEAEARESLPFRPYAAAGSILERCINRAGFRREEFGVYNVVNCRPPANKLEGQKYEAGAVDHCKRHVQTVIDRYRPRVILAAGGVPCKWLTGEYGPKKSISLLRGFVFKSVYGIPVIPTLHPAFIARGQSKYLPVLIRDLQYAVQIAREGVKLDRKDYDEHPTPADVRDYVSFLRSNPRLPVSYDIETDYSLRQPDEEDVRNVGRNIEQIQFSHEPHQAIVLPWVGEYIELAREILALPNPKWGWNNWSFDDPILEEHGCKISGENRDLMWAWHHLQPDLPRGLQFVTSFYAPEVGAWKHLSEAQPQFYGGIDVDAVSRIGQRVFTDLDNTGVSRGYYRHILALQPILKRMCDRGFPVDRAARDAFRAKIQETSDELLRSIESCAPDSIRKIHPPNGIKVAPKPLKELALWSEIKMGKGRDPYFPESFKRTVKANLGLGCKQFPDGYERFFRQLPFQPSSDEQIKAYIRAKGHKMPTKLKERDDAGRPKETTEKRGLERLYKQTGDNFYLKVIEFRELQKIASTYIDGWKLDEQGRVHSEFMFAPATGQLSSRNPNIQNIPKTGELADEFRKIIRPRAGHVLVAFDYSAFHVLTLGFEAKCADYMRLARLDIHSFVAGHLLKLEGRDGWLQLSSSDLAGVLGEIKTSHKSVRNKKAKPGILGYGLGLGAQKLYDMNLESFSSRKEAQGVINMLNELFPAVARFREEVKALASQQGFLRSDHGYIRRFNDIYHYRQVSEQYEPNPGEQVFAGRNGRRYKKVTGEEGEAAIAQLVQNDAHGHIKDVIIDLAERELDERYGFINTIHDELLFECPETLLQDCLADVSAAMEKPSAILVDPEVAPKGLACGIEASVGRESWFKMDTVYKTPIEQLLAA